MRFFFCILLLFANSHLTQADLKIPSEKPATCENTLILDNTVLAQKLLIRALLKPTQLDSKISILKGILSEDWAAIALDSDVYISTLSEWLHFEANKSITAITFAPIFEPGQDQALPIPALWVLNEDGKLTLKNLATQNNETILESFQIDHPETLSAPSLKWNGETGAIEVWMTPSFSNDPFLFQKFYPSSALLRGRLNLFQTAASEGEQSLLAAMVVFQQQQISRNVLERDEDFFYQPTEKSNETMVILPKEQRALRVISSFTATRIQLWDTKQLKLMQTLELTCDAQLLLAVEHSQKQLRFYLKTNHDIITLQTENTHHNTLVLVATTHISSHYLMHSEFSSDLRHLAILDFNGAVTVLSLPAAPGAAPHILTQSNSNPAFGATQKTRLTFFKNKLRVSAENSDHSMTNLEIPLNH